MSADAVRTPDERFEGLPDFPWEPRYREWEGLRLAHLDIGPADGPVVVLWHGEPTWSFLWRKVIPPLVAAGYRCIAPDLPGFGRSDKPTDFGWYSYDRHTSAGAHLMEHLGIADATFVVHDWGGPVGLRVATDHPGHASRLVILDTGLFTGEQRMSDAWIAFHDFVERTEDIPISMLVGGACATPPTPEVLAAYDAPYPTPASKAGARAFPLMIPQRPDMPGAAEGRTTLLALREWDVPKLVLWADGDPVLPFATGERFAQAVGAPAPETVANASHFLQEDAGQWIGERIVAWLGEQAPAGA
jgi:haloalkane dehalogenase